MNQHEDGSQGFGFYLAIIAKVIMTVGVALYLGKHSLNFFNFTFKGQDEIFSWLGLLTTSGGVAIWLLILLYLADSGLQKTVALVMVIVSLLGELIVAGFDMYMNISGQIAGGVTFTPEEMKTISYVVAGLGFVHALALVVDLIGDFVSEQWTNIRRGGLSKEKDNSEAVSTTPLPAPAPALGFVPASKVEDGRKYEQVLEWREVAPVVVTPPSAPFQSE